MNRSLNRVLGFLEDALQGGGLLGMALGALAAAGYVMFRPNVDHLRRQDPPTPSPIAVTEVLPNPPPPALPSTDPTASYGTELLLPADVFETRAMADHSPVTRLGRWRRAWTVDRVRDDPGRRWIAERLATLSTPVELVVEIGNAAWEQQELRRFAAQHPELRPDAVRFVAISLSQIRLFQLESGGFTNLSPAWKDLIEAPVQGYVQLTRPVGPDVPSGSSLPEPEALDPSERAFYTVAAKMEVHHEILYHKIQAWLDDLGYAPLARPYLIAQVYADLQNTWAYGFFDEGFGAEGAMPFPKTVLGPEPPTAMLGKDSAAWLYRRFCIQYLKNHGGPADDRFYEDVYSVGLPY